MKMDSHNTFQRFFRDANGSATIEFVLWVPLFGFLLMLTANAAFTYLDMTRMENAARDGARRISIGIDSASVTNTVAAQLPDGDYTVDVSCTTVEVACVRISRPSDSMLPFNNFMGVGNLLGKTFGAEVRMRREPGYGHLDLVPSTASKLG